MGIAYQTARGSLCFGLFCAVDLSACTPDSADGIGLSAIHAALETLSGVQILGLEQLVICQHNGVKGIARGKARLLAEEGGACAGTQIPAFRHGEEGRFLFVKHVAGLRGADGGTHYIEHIQVIATGNVTAKANIQTPV